MQKMIALFSRLLLVCALTLSGPAVTVSSAGTPGSIMMTICGENGAEVVWIDADGNPVAPAEDCSDCQNCLCSPLIDLTTVWSDDFRANPPFTAITSGGDQVLCLSTASLRPCPRGPPVQPVAALGQAGMPVSALHDHGAIWVSLEFSQPNPKQRQVSHRAQSENAP